MQSQPPASERSSSAVKSRSHTSSRLVKTSKDVTLSSNTPLKLDPTALVCEKVNILGSHPITIAASAVINPFATLDSSAGPIDIGEGCIVWERATIGSLIRSPSEDAPILVDPSAARTVLRKHSVIEAQSIIETGAEVGEGCVIGVGARVGINTVIGEFTRLGPLTAIPPNSAVPAYTMFFHTSQDGDETSVQQSRVNASLRDNPRVRALQARSHEQMLLALRATLGRSGPKMSFG